MIYLLDTDTFVFLVRSRHTLTPRSERERKNHQAAQRILTRCRQATAAADLLGVSAITVAELEFGARRGGRYQEQAVGLRETLAPFEAFAFDATESPVHYGEVRHALEAAGLPIGPLDTLIAAHALALGATLVTNNTAEFARVKRLRCENWAA